MFNPYRAAAFCTREAEDALSPAGERDENFVGDYDQISHVPFEREEFSLFFISIIELGLVLAFGFCGLLVHQGKHPL